MKKSKLYLQIVLASIIIAFIMVQPINAQSKKRGKRNTINFPESSYASLEYRSIGPFRGGRSAAVTGVPGNPNLFYFGAAGG